VLWKLFDLEDYYPKGIRSQVDISQWLLEGFSIERKDFREHLKKSRLDTVSGSVCGYQLQYGRHCSGMGFHLSY
jgi:hypothetical protein